MMIHFLNKTENQFKLLKMKKFQLIIIKNYRKTKKMMIQNLYSKNKMNKNKLILKI